jgi:hypothetical protein
MFLAVGKRASGEWGASASIYAVTGFGMGARLAEHCCIAPTRAGAWADLQSWLTEQMREQLK